MNDDELKDFGETIRDYVNRLSAIANDISILTLVIREELLQMDEPTFWKKVCHGIISDFLDTAPVGTHLFQCPWSNREYFDSINNPKHYMIGNDKARSERVKEDRAEIWVNIAKLARFAMECPFAGTPRCPLRHFIFMSDEEQERRKETI